MKFGAYFWALLLALALSVGSFDAAAQTTADCPDGGEVCTVTTCASETCFVFICTNGDCVLQTSYPNPGGTTPPPDGMTTHQPGAEKGNASLLGGFHESASGNMRFVHCRQNRCAVRMCSAQECAVFGFDRGASFEITRYENTEGAADAAISRFLRDGPSAIVPNDPER